MLTFLSMGNFHFNALRMSQVTKKDGDLPVRSIRLTAQEWIS